MAEEDMDGDHLHNHVDFAITEENNTNEDEAVLKPKDNGKDIPSPKHQD